MPDPKFLLQSKRDSGLSGPTLSVHLPVVYLDEEGQARNPLSSGYSGDDVLGHLADFEVGALYQPELGWYGYHAEFRNVYSVDLRRAESMVKTLRSLTRKLDAASIRFGSPPDFPTYAARVAEAVGAKLDGHTFGLDHPRGEQIWASGERYRWTDVDGLRYRLNDLARELTPEAVK